MTGVNWAGNVVFRARRQARPASIEELQAVVAGSDRVRALGSGHSFNRIADTDGTQLTVSGLPREIEIDTSARCVRVSAGLTYAELAPHLQDAGLALPNLGSLPHISIAGACATGTHGSGNGNGNLATAVSAIEMVTASGGVVALSRADDADRFDGAVVGLGCLGIVTRMTLDLVASFAVAQYVFEDLADESLDEHVDEIFASGYSVSVFTDFRSNRIWCKRLATDPPPAERMFGATAAPEQRNPVPGMSAANSTRQLGVPGPWHERLPHFRPEFTPSSGAELQSEYLLPRRHAVAAVREVRALREQITPLLQIAEMRTVAADALWLSPSYQRETVGLHFTWVDDTAAVIPVVQAIERRLAPFRPRPHWGKVFAIPPAAVGAEYEWMPAFGELMREYDPHGKFRNALVDEYVSLA
jgi:xylitol oxidase